MNSKDDIQIGAMVWVRRRLDHGGYILAEVARETKTQWVLDNGCRVRKKDLRATPSNKFMRIQLATKEELDYVAELKDYPGGIREVRCLTSNLQRQYEESLQRVYRAGPNVTSGLPSEYTDKLKRAKLLLQELLNELEALPK